jgi:hypothetical protein
MDNSNTYQLLIVLLLVIWSTVWKGIAMWRSGRRDQKVWFVAILILNTVGILEIIYLLLNRNKKDLVKNK